MTRQPLLTAFCRTELLMLKDTGIEFDCVDAALSGVDRKINPSFSAQIDESPSMGVLALDGSLGAARMDGRHVVRQELVNLVDAGVISGLAMPADKFSYDSPVQPPRSTFTSEVYTFHAPWRTRQGRTPPANRTSLRTGETVLIRTAEVLKLPNGVGGFAFPPSRFRGQSVACDQCRTRRPRVQWAFAVHPHQYGARASEN